MSDSLRDRIAAASVELRVNCDNEIVCDWGVFTNPDPGGSPSKPVSHLILAGTAYVKELLKSGPAIDRYGNLSAARAVADDLFIDYTIGGKKWTWELYRCHWWDETDDDPNMWVGRWMD